MLWGRLNFVVPTVSCVKLFGRWRKAARSVTAGEETSGNLNEREVGTDSFECH